MPRRFAGRATANSSPPSRPSKSVCRLMPRIRLAKHCSTFVSDGMTMTVVDLLEMIDIDHQHRQWPLVSPRAWANSVSRDFLEELPPIWEFRQVVQSRKFAQLLRGANEARNVVKRHQAAAVRQGLAFELQDATVTQAKPAFAMADVVLNGTGGCLVEARSAPMFDDFCKVVRRAGGRHGQIPYSIEGAVDELRFKRRAQHDEAVVHFIQC